VEETAKGSDNLLPVMKDALRAGCTLGEISDALRNVFGIHRPG
jgi:methylmalonyl-CoA mutase, N-terminal domain